MADEDAHGSCSDIRDALYLAAEMDSLVTTYGIAVCATDKIVFLSVDSAIGGTVRNFAAGSDSTYKASDTYLIFRRGRDLGIGRTVYDIRDRKSSHATGMEIIHAF